MAACRLGRRCRSTALPRTTITYPESPRNRACSTALEINKNRICSLSGQNSREATRAGPAIVPTRGLLPDGRTSPSLTGAAVRAGLLDPETLQQRNHASPSATTAKWQQDRQGRPRPARRQLGANSVNVIDGKVTETIKTSLDPDAGRLDPDACAISRGGKRLYVANADNNDVAVSTPRRAIEALGFIPTGWYPVTSPSPGGASSSSAPPRSSAFTPVPDGHRLSAPVPDPSSLTITSAACSTWRCARWSTCPTAPALAEYTKQVLSNFPAPKQAVDEATAQLASAISAKIEHVIYIIRENRTYDQVFGDRRRGSAPAIDPALRSLREAKVTPNGHRPAPAASSPLARLYCNGEVSSERPPVVRRRLPDLFHRAKPGSNSYAWPASRPTAHA